MANLSAGFKASILKTAAAIERMRQIRCAKIIAHAKALNDDLVALDTRNQAIIRSAQKAAERSTTAIKRSDDVNQRIDLLLARTETLADL